MTLGKLIIMVALIALGLTLIAGPVLKRVKNYPISYLQNFVGALFIFSGWVKAIDPLGTAYKMEQYFAEFESTFAGTWFNWLAPLFPKLSEVSIGFSVFMIVFEIILGLMFIIGLRRKLTAWLFLLLVVFFTFLTGFTYLTGYVPEGANFFQFGKWGPYVETNMKVTDCGCFGDFLKLEPKVSFFKDVFLLIPGILLLLFWRNMHQLFSTGLRWLIGILATIGLTVYCFSNYVWDLPHTDFRPFHEQANLRFDRKLEALAEENVDILAYHLTNKSTGEVVELPFNDYLKQYKDYPKEAWEAEQIKTTPSLSITRQGDQVSIPGIEDASEAATIGAYVKKDWDLAEGTTTRVLEGTKVSEFEVSNPANGSDLTGDLLNYPGYSIMIVAYKLKGSERKETQTYKDTIYREEMVVTEFGDTITNLVVESIENKQRVVTLYDWKNAYIHDWAETQTFADQASADGLPVVGLTSYTSPERVKSFQEAAAFEQMMLTADDILLKTIIRSNPGVLLMKDGEVVQKWHRSKLPDWDTVKSNFDIPAKGTTKPNTEKKQPAEDETKQSSDTPDKKN